jgi:2,3-bisphosphoglycerate-dependent phosphoglycerate mutase
MVFTMKTVNTQQTRRKTEGNIVPVVLIRHAQSQWNRENRFTGWANPALTEVGIAEAKRAGTWLHRHGYRFDVVWSSRLQRAISTCEILLEQIGQAAIPLFEDWRLNERHYGMLQGIDKAAATVQVGEQQVWSWRRSYTERAEPLPRTHADHPSNSPMYAEVEPHRLPGVESLADTRARVVPFWREQVVPRIQHGERVLISAHGNTLRALLMELANMTVDEVEGFEIPTATPILYRFDDSGEPLDWRYLDVGTEMARTA